jgi:hypothetical protein
VGASGDIANGTATAVIPAAAGQSICLTGFEITGSGATSAKDVVATITSYNKPLTYAIHVPAGVNVGMTPFGVQFYPAVLLPPSTSGILTVQPFGIGNKHASAVLHGFSSDITNPNFPCSGYTGASGDVSNAPAVATMSGSGGLLCLTGFEITGSGADRIADVLATVTGLGQTMTYVLNVPAGPTIGLAPLFVYFNPPLLQSNPGGIPPPITVTVPPFGNGNNHVDVVVHGGVLRATANGGTICP